MEVIKYVIKHPEKDLFLCKKNRLYEWNSFDSFSLKEFKTVKGALDIAREKGGLIKRVKTSLLNDDPIILELNNELNKK